MVKFILTGLPRSVKSQGKTTFFQGQGKVGEFGIWSGKLFCKFAEKSEKNQGDLTHFGCIELFSFEHVNKKLKTM